MAAGEGNYPIQAGGGGRPGGVSLNVCLEPGGPAESGDAALSGERMFAMPRPMARSGSIANGRARANAGPRQTRAPRWPGEQRRAGGCRCEASGATSKVTAERQSDHCLLYPVACDTPLEAERRDPGDRLYVITAGSINVFSAPARR